MVSIGVAYDEIGDREDLDSLPYGAGIPKAVSDMTIAVRSTTRVRWSGGSSVLTAEDRAPACVIMEAAMMNLGVVLRSRATSRRYARSPSATASC